MTLFEALLDASREVTAVQDAAATPAAPADAKPNVKPDSAASNQGSGAAQTPSSAKAGLPQVAGIPNPVIAAQPGKSGSACGKAADSAGQSSGESGKTGDSQPDSPSLSDQPANTAGPAAVLALGIVPAATGTPATAPQPVQSAGSPAAKGDGKTDSDGKKDDSSDQSPDGVAPAAATALAAVPIAPGLPAPANAPVPAPQAQTSTSDQSGAPAIAQSAGPRAQFAAVDRPMATMAALSPAGQRAKDTKEAVAARPAGQAPDADGPDASPADAPLLPATDPKAAAQPVPEALRKLTESFAPSHRSVDDASRGDGPTADMTASGTLFSAAAGTAAAASSAATSGAASSSASGATASTSAPLQQPVPLAGVPVLIAARALAGNHQFDIRLDPPELGRIEVRLKVDKQGQVSSHLIADRADTLNLLRRDEAGLQRALQDAGFKAGGENLQFSLRDQSGGQSDGRAAPRAVLPEDDASVPREVAPRSYVQYSGRLGGLDIRI